MNIFDQLSLNQHEQIVYCNDHRSGLKAIIAVHNTNLGPALGGCRMYPYQSEQDALTDVLRLSRGMTYKAAVSGLNLGGGKSVIIGDPKKIASESLFRAFGRFINSLNGRYITAEDVGTTVRNMEWIRQETKYVTGIPTYFGGSGDPSPFTAHGTFVGMKAAVKKVKGSDSMAGIKVVIEGVGNVGYHLCKELHQVGAKVFVYDINPDQIQRVVKEFQVTPVKKEELYGLDVDVYSPCALGATVSDQTIQQFKCAIIAGAANNQLADDVKHGLVLAQKGILYAPDYVINAGGLINVYREIHGGGEKHVWDKIEGIYDTSMQIFARAETDNISTADAANKLGEERIKTVSRTRDIWVV
jgi:leucine dehydrogenase